MTLSQLQAQAREEFLKRFEEQEFTNHLGYPERGLFLPYLDSLIASSFAAAQKTALPVMAHSRRLVMDGMRSLEI